jgi:hypothetical protein
VQTWRTALGVAAATVLGVSMACGHTAVGVGGAAVVSFLLFFFFSFLEIRSHSNFPVSDQNPVVKARLEPIVIVVCGVVTPFEQTSR